MRRRVVITGVGCVTPLGTTVDSLWANLMAGKSGVGRTTIFDASSFPTKISAEVKDWSVADVGLDAAEWADRSRHTCFAAGAAQQAMAESGVLGTVEPTRFGVYLGAGEGSQDFFNFSQMMTAAVQGGDLDMHAFVTEGLKILDPQAELEQEPNMPVGYLAGMFDAQGPNVNCLTACAASSQAIGEATEIIRSGEADVMLSGGAHSMIHPFGVTGFNLLTALSERNDEPERASRPFDKNRDGFVLGEGGAMVVLEEYEHARKRGAPIYGELLGYGTTADAFRITDTHPEGRGGISCLKMALKDAGKDPTDVDYINAHGTSTAVNDRVESLAIRQVFGEHADKLPVSSTKSMTGHLIAAAGATELIICLMAMKHKVLPPTINYETPDPECDLDYIPNVAREAKCDVSASNSFGFGGQNVSLVAGII
ncbi:beta-ketoacyl-[acyl-carrier-protein] synthase family protein [Bythopirellula polymerisocia]|uniref:3-oxoacyl-[acyl-carrier-protein] synthase 2 n=1 Tax=Bythopirellula polymerisocia TaxID=2528003 RepID=A0A5C6D109_9BACT|nr:beta-ketoacyl-[acyl-carrier-protein] synthase family protein [Bythopirellula polymerisocia]TWU29865.1 3-oxoacyl-[acyl-carrier-protein] synthase 2 [Bythopirellula polymerisocia]